MITMFRCEVCGSEYGLRELCERCEAAPPVEYRYAVGDVVLVKTRYTGLKPHKIVALGQGQGLLYMLGAIKTAEELAAYGKPLPVAHHPLYQIAEVEQLGKSHFTDWISEGYIKGLVAEVSL